MKAGSLFGADDGDDGDDDEDDDEDDDADDDDDDDDDDEEAGSLNVCEANLFDTPVLSLTRM